MKKLKKILVVEDEEFIRALYKRFLASLGYEAVFAGGTKEATAKIQGSDDFDLLVTDMKLPDGDGIEVIRRFREKYPTMKVLIVTGSPAPENKEGSLQEMDFSKQDILAKPFLMKEFESAIRNCLEGK